MRLESHISLDDAIEMRESGATLQEIASKYGVTRERVRQMIGNKARRNNTDIQRIKFDGLYRFFSENNISYSMFFRKLNKSPDPIRTRKFSDFMSGQNEDQHFNIAQIFAMEKLTGMTFDELFAPRKTVDE